MTITWSQFVWGFGLLLAWTGLLLGAIKYLLNRQIAAFETKLTEADAKAVKALADLSTHEQTVTKDISAIRLEINQKLVCSNHQRMEDDNKDQFVRMDELHGDIREMVGKFDGLQKSIDMLVQHHINGGK